MMAPNVEMVVFDIALHLNPAKLRDRLQQQIDAMEEKGTDIVLGYGLCGRSVEGLVSRKSRLILPRVDDCVGAILGSRKRHQSYLKEQSGCYFLEPTWLGTTLDIFTECKKGLEHIPESRRFQIVQMALKNYSKLALLNHNGSDAQAMSHCRMLARSHGLEFIEVPSDPGLLKRLSRGDWSGEDVVAVEPGCKIPFF